MIYCNVQQSVVTAFQSDSPFLRAILFSISLGGDTDTIGSMAGAIAGQGKRFPYFFFCVIWTLFCYVICELKG